MRYSVIYTTDRRRHVVTHRIERVPAEIRVADVRAALSASEWAPALTTAGVFMANRRVTSTEPADAVEVPSGVRTIEWRELIDGRRTAQLNFRVRPADRARWQHAADTAGMSLASWMVDKLNAACETDEGVPA